MPSINSRSKCHYFLFKHKIGYSHSISKIFNPWVLQKFTSTISDISKIHYRKIFLNKNDMDSKKEASFCIDR